MLRRICTYLCKNLLKKTAFLCYVSAYLCIFVLSFRDGSLTAAAPPVLFLSWGTLEKTFCYAWNLLASTFEALITVSGSNYILLQLKLFSSNRSSVHDDGLWHVSSNFVFEFLCQFVHLAYYREWKWNRISFIWKIISFIDNDIINRTLTLILVDIWWWIADYWWRSTDDCCDP